MAGDEVHDNLDAAFVGLTDQFDHVGVRAKARIHLVIVDYVVTTVHPAGFINRIQPDGRHPDTLDIVELQSNPGDVADAVSVGIHIGRRINLVEYRPVQPFRIILCIRARQRSQQSHHQKQKSLHRIHSFLIQHNTNIAILSVNYGDYSLFD